jgi:hypothetical protein
MQSKTLVRLTTTTAAALLAIAGSVYVASDASANSGARALSANDLSGTAYNEIINGAYGQCADAPGGALNVHLSLAQCSPNDPTQAWTLVQTGTAGTFFIVNRASGYCMEVNNGTSAPTEPVDEWFCDGLPSEMWIQETDTHRLRHFGTNQCLDTVAGPGSELMQFTCGQEAPPNVQTWAISQPSS